MFKKINCIQGTDEWHKARLGLFTASSFSNLLTQKTFKQSASYKKEVCKKIAEKIVGIEEVEFQSNAMLRGQAMEHEALEYFNFSFGYHFQKTGFLIATDKHGNELGYGCSPDGLDENNKMGLELKCPLAHTHISYLLETTIPSEYYLQVQGSLLVTGYDKWVFGSYHPDFPCLRIEVYRDEEVLKELENVIMNCVELVNMSMNKLGLNAK